jgi:pimeloyl-ACP methyl ester carboxylesterase
MKIRLFLVLTIIFQMIIIKDMYSQNTISKKNINIKGTDVAFEVHGQGKPIIMLHGFGLDRETMIGCMEPLFEKREGWRRIYFDLPGMGQTPKVKWIKNSNDMLKFVLLFVEQSIPNEKFLLVGESYGGYLARAIIKDRGQQVDGMLLICPLVVPEMKKRDITRSSALYRDEEICNNLSVIDNMIFNSFATIQNQKNWERINKEMISGTDKGDSFFRSEIRKEENYTLPNKYNKSNTPFDKPALILTGKQDNLVGYRDIWKMTENYPRASFAVLDMAGHALQIEQDELFNALVNNWLLRLEK